MTENVHTEPQPLPTDVPEGHVGLSLRIENAYELYEDVVTYRAVVVPLPPSQDGEDDASVQARRDWEWDYIFCWTGVGHEDGDSWHDVEILESSHPDIVAVGNKYDFGD